MLLINYTEDKFISVINIEGKTVQVDPKRSVEVADVEGIMYLQNYSHIFKRVETGIESKSVLADKVSALEAKLIAKDNYIAELEAKLGIEHKQTEVVVEATENTEEEQELIDTRALYFEVLGKEVPKNKKNDIEWIKAKLEEAKVVTE